MEDKSSSNASPSPLDATRHSSDETPAPSGPFTPGPWSLSGVRQKINGQDSHSILATVGGKETIIASVWYDPKTHAGFHDAKLMAASMGALEALIEARDLLIERTQGSPARSAAHNARLVIDAAIAEALGPSISKTPPAPRKTTAMESHNHSEGEG